MVRIDELQRRIQTLEQAVMSAEVNRSSFPDAVPPKKSRIKPRTLATRCVGSMSGNFKEAWNSGHEKGLNLVKNLDEFGTSWTNRPGACSSCERMSKHNETLNCWLRS